MTPNGITSRNLVVMVWGFRETAASHKKYLGKQEYEGNHNVMNKQKMKEINKIGLNTEKSKELAILLNDLLAEYSIFYQNVRGYHWNIQGDKFFELHSKFEEMYNDLFHKIDEVAERILTLGFAPNYTFTSYLKTAKIKESDQSNDGYTSVQEIIGSLQIILSKQRVILDKSGALNDAGTNALMNDYISEQEKLIWMYSAYLK